MAQGMRHCTSVRSPKIWGKELLKEGAAWMAGKLIFPGGGQRALSGSARPWGHCPREGGAETGAPTARKGPSPKEA